jgi:ketosteroid isomerase-like protein
LAAALRIREIDAIRARMTDDCAFESTGPPPDGQRHDGQAAVRAAGEQFFSEATDPKFTNEDTFLSGDQACVRWPFTWISDDGSEGHVRGVDVIRFRDGLVSMSSPFFAHGGLSLPVG